MNLDGYYAQYGRQTAIILKEVESARCDFKSATIHRVIARSASTKPGLNQTVRFQIKQVPDDGAVVSLLLNFLPSFMSRVWIGAGQDLKDFTLQVSIKLHGQFLLEEFS